MNLALGIEYSGSNYCGWQKQTHSPSVQQHLEEALSEIANSKIKVFCAGRTDTGVHANGQVVNFELPVERPLRAWLSGANTKLPFDISILWAKQMAQNFHARHSALSRRYRYVIQNTSYPVGTLAGKVLWHKPLLDADKMNQSAQALIGEKSFASFQASSCQSRTPYRHVHQVSVKRWNDFVIIDIKASAFLHHMVRNIVGCLLEIGQGREPINFVTKILEKQDRTQAPKTAKPDGLYLVQVEYPANAEIPQTPLGPLLLPDIF